MTRIVIIGTGPAAAAAAMALAPSPSHELEIVDIGERLEADAVRLLGSLDGIPPSNWEAVDLDALRRQPVRPSRTELPEKWIFGSDFPFRDLGQLTAVSTEKGGNKRIVSGAFGGFSNAWGAQVMPFTKDTLNAWPTGYDSLLPHYEAVLNQIPFSGAEDDYSALFPLMVPAAPLPQLAPPFRRVLERYGRHQPLIRRAGVTIGQARLALDAARCIECGLCLTGCPSHRVYAAPQTLEPLIRAGRVTYRDGLLVTRVGEDEQGCWIEAQDLGLRAPVTIRADKVFVACGGLGTTRVVLNSIRTHVRSVRLHESVQFVLPFLSTKPSRDPRGYTTFTLNQLNMLIAFRTAGLDLAQIHLYPYNETFDEALPGPIMRRPRLRAAALSRVTAGLGYLPSWVSPAVEARVTSRGDACLPGIVLRSLERPGTRRALASVLARLLRVAPHLDMWPVLPSLTVSGVGKSYHFGGSLPHITGSPRVGALETDLLGRPAEWQNTHLIDASVFPSVAATTFTLTVMANAHRIASAAI